MLPLLAAGGGILQGALGLFGANKRANQARELERANQRENVLNQAWAGMLGPQAKKEEYIEKPSALAGALQGGLAGAMQGMNVYQGLKDAEAARALKNKLAGQAVMNETLSQSLPTSAINLRGMPTGTLAPQNPMDMYMKKQAGGSGLFNLMG